MKNKDNRYPYTYACDLIRSVVGYNPKPPLGTKLSRSDASKIIQALAVISKVDHGAFAAKLADYYLEHESDITNVSVEEFLKTWEIKNEI